MGGALLRTSKYPWGTGQTRIVIIGFITILFLTSIFAAKRDRLYVVVTAVVLALLLFSTLVTPLIPGFYA